ncbi:hypothetical protein Tco_1172193 [Tanacetum coccineum]
MSSVANSLASCCIVFGLVAITLPWIVSGKPDHISQLGLFLPETSNRTLVPVLGNVGYSVLHGIACAASGSSGSISGKFHNECSTASPGASGFVLCDQSFCGPLMPLKIGPSVSEVLSATLFRSQLNCLLWSDANNSEITLGSLDLPIGNRLWNNIVLSQKI